jgi:DNA mismatch repair ATPase MutS
VLTPGTLIDESFLNPHENNYLLAVGSSKSSSDSLGLAWIDVSTGEFFSESTSVQSLRDDLARIRPSEVVLLRNTQTVTADPVLTVVNEEKCHVTFVDDIKLTENLPESISTELDQMLLETTINGFTNQETDAIWLLTTFLKSHLLDHMPEMALPSRQQHDLRMQIDAQTIRALEIKESMNGGGLAGSLISTIKRTATQSGSRLLTRWICK